MERLGPYTILETVGRGGQGVVYLAEDTRLKRRVALKVLDEGPERISEHHRARLRREAEAASQLDHPNICTIHEAGEIDGTPFIAMRYVEGQPLAQWIETESIKRATDTSSSVSSQSAIHAILARVECVARALHVAHEHGLIHRDVKPGNIMLTSEGTPVVLDFGLARQELDLEGGLTQSGDLLGTPAYMSPEQLVAQRIPLDRRTDVYSLGVTLFECLVLRRPFVGLTRAELYQRILSHDVPRLSTENRGIPRDVEIVVETAMEKDRDRRYQSALDFAEDLRRIREFEPIRAKPIGTALRVKRWAQRRPAVAIAISAWIVVSILVVLFSIEQSAVATRAKSAATRAEAAALAGASMSAPDDRRALGLALRGFELDETPLTRTALHRAYSRTREDVVLLHGESVLAGVFHPDGTEVATCSGDSVFFWTLNGDEAAEPIEHPDRVRDVVYAGESHVLTACKDGFVRCWNLVTREYEQYPDAADQRGDEWHGVLRVRDRSNGTIVAAYQDGAVRVWRRNSNSKPIKEISNAHGRGVTNIDVSGKRLATASGDGTIGFYDLETGETLRPLFRSPFPGNPFIGDVEFLSGNNEIRIVFGAYTGIGAVKDLDAEGFESILQPHSAAVEGVAASPDEHLIATADNNGVIRIFDRTGRGQLELRGHRAIAWSVQWSADGKRLLTTSDDGTARIWSIHVPQAETFLEPRAAVGEARFRGDSILAIDKAGNLLEWSEDLESRLLAEFDRETWQLAIGRNGQIAFTGNSCARLFRLSGAKTRVLFDTDAEEKRTSPVRCVRFSSKGDRVATFGQQVVQIWSLDGKLQHEIKARHSNAGIGSGCFVDGDRKLVIGDAKGVSLWDIATESILDFKDVHRVWVHDVNLSSVDPSLMVSASDDGFVKVWRISGESLQFVREIRHPSAVRSAVFTHDGKHILTTARDTAGYMWTLDGQLVMRFEGHTGVARYIRPHATKNRAVTSGIDRTVRLWITDPEELLELARQRYGTGRQFSVRELEESAGIRQH